MKLLSESRIQFFQLHSFNVFEEQQLDRITQKFCFYDSNVCQFLQFYLDIRTADESLVIHYMSK